ncbi:MAG: TetR/AcrR family transcriptional regulator [Pseudomonadota bacterium]
MARTQALDYDDKRDRIMKRAAMLFAKSGFGDTSISELAEACGVSKATIYHYYRSKEDILYKVMLEHVDELLDAITNLETEGHSAQDNFRNLTRLLLKLYAGAQYSQRALLSELDNLSRSQRKTIVARERRIVEEVEALLTAAKGPSSTSRAETMLYFGMLNWTPNWFRPKGELNRDELADLASAIVLGR